MAEERRAVDDLGFPEHHELFEARANLLGEQRGREDAELDAVDVNVGPLQLDEAALHRDGHRVVAVSLGHLLGAVDEAAANLEAPGLIGAAEDHEPLGLDVVERLKRDARGDAGRLLRLDGHLREARLVEGVFGQFTRASANVLVDEVHLLDGRRAASGVPRDGDTVPDLLVVDLRRVRNEDVDARQVEHLRETLRALVDLVLVAFDLFDEAMAPAANERVVVVEDDVGEVVRRPGLVDQRARRRDDDVTPSALVLLGLFALVAWLALRLRVFVFLGDRVIVDVLALQVLFGAIAKVPCIDDVDAVDGRTAVRVVPIVV